MSSMRRFFTGMVFIILSGTFPAYGQSLVTVCMPEVVGSVLVVFTPDSSKQDTAIAKDLLEKRLPVFTVDNVNVYALNYNERRAFENERQLINLNLVHVAGINTVKPELDSYFKPRFYGRRKISDRAWYVVGSLDSCRQQIASSDMKINYQRQEATFHLLQVRGLQSDLLLWSIRNEYNDQFSVAEKILAEHIFFQYLKKRLDRRKLRITNPVTNLFDPSFPAYLPNVVISGNSSHVRWLVEKWPLLVRAFVNELQKLDFNATRENLTVQLEQRAVSWRALLTFRIKQFLKYGYRQPIKKIQSQWRRLDSEKFIAKLTQLFQRQGYECFWVRNGSFPKQWPLKDYKYEKVNMKHGGSDD